MKGNKTRAAALLLALVLTATLAACMAKSPAASASPSAPSSYYGHNRGYWRGERQKYTQADYDLALSFRTGGYEAMSVADFNHKVLPWDDEAQYHKTEEALQRLFDTLPDNDPNADFIFGVLSDTWDECERKHYNTCERRQEPWHGGSACLETFGDVYGDPVTLTSADAWFSFDYSIPDEKALTVGERSTLLKSLDEGLTAYLSRQTPQALAGEKTMEKSLTAELQRLLKALDKRIVWGGECDLDYSWYQSYDSGEDEEARESKRERPETYTKAQYDFVLQALKFEGYENMPVGEFDRRINAAFEQDDYKSWEDSLSFAYDMLREYLPESDPNYDFLRTGVRTALKEYEARYDEVVSGKTVDPEHYGEANVTLKADVFGDEVTVGMVEADYTFTYRILNADKLTVQARDAFLSAVEKGVQDYLDKAAQSSGRITKASLKAALEQAGKAAGNANIQFTGCEIGYYDDWS